MTQLNNAVLSWPPSLREELFLERTYHSNAIEGNTMSLSETKTVLEGFTVGGKKICELHEVLDHKDAIRYVEDIVKSNENLTESLICHLNTHTKKHQTQASGSLSKCTSFYR